MIRVPITGRRLAHLAIYLLGRVRFAVVFLAVFLASWYWISGIFLEPLLARTWTRDAELWFLLVPGVCFFAALVTAALRASRIPAPFVIARLPATQTRSIGVWIRTLIDLAAETNRGRGRLLWLARRLRREDPERICTMHELPAIVYGRPRVYLCVLGVATVSVWLATSPPGAGEWLARVTAPEANRYRLIGVQVCSQWSGACVTPRTDPVLDEARPVEMFADVDPAGRLALTLDPNPRTWPIVRAVSTDARAYVWLDGDSNESMLERHETVYGRQLVVRYRFAETELATVLRIDVLTYGGHRRQQTLLHLRTVPPNFAAGSPSGGS